jgi:transposase
VVAEYDAAATDEKGAVLRRERLYSSHVIEWHRVTSGACSSLGKTP